jgi:hypothetical protein
MVEVVVVQIVNVVQLDDDFVRSKLRRQVVLGGGNSVTYSRTALLLDSDIAQTRLYRICKRRAPISVSEDVEV